MDSLSQLGVVMHWAVIALQVHLVLKLWQDPATFKVRPLFFWYSVLLLFSTSTLFVGYHVLSHAPYCGYFLLFWMVTSVEGALGMGVAGELWGLGWEGLAIGLIGAIVMFTNEWNIPPMTGARILGAVIAISAFLYSIGSRKLARFRTSPVENQYIAAGLVVFLTFPAILYRFHVPEWTTYIPVYAGLLARVIWLKVTTERKSSFVRR